MSDRANDPQQLAQYIHFREDGRRRQNKLDEAFQKAIHFQLAEWYGFDCFIYEAANLFAEAGRVIAEAGVADAIPTPETCHGRYTSPQLLAEALGVVRSAVSRDPIEEIASRLHRIRNDDQYLWARWVWDSIVSYPKSLFRERWQAERDQRFPNWQELDKQNARAQERMTGLDRAIRTKEQTATDQRRHQFKTEVEDPLAKLLPQWVNAWEDLYAHLRQCQLSTEISIQSARQLASSLKRVGGLLQQLARPLAVRHKFSALSLGGGWLRLPGDVRERLGWMARRDAPINSPPHPPEATDPLSIEADYKYRKVWFDDKTPANAAELLLSAIGLTEIDLADRLNRLLSPDFCRSLFGWLPLIRNWLLFPDPPVDAPAGPPFGLELQDYQKARLIMTGEKPRDGKPLTAEPDASRPDSYREDLESLMARALERSDNPGRKTTLVSLPNGPVAHRFIPECMSCEFGSPDVGQWRDEVFYWPFRVKDYFGSVQGSQDTFVALSSQIEDAEEFRELASQAGAAIALAAPTWLEPIGDRWESTRWAATIMNWSPSAKRMAKKLPSGIQVLEDAWAASAAALRDVLSPSTISQTPDLSVDAPQNLEPVVEKAKNDLAASQSEKVNGAPALPGRVKEPAQVPGSGSDPLPPKVPQVEEPEPDGPQAGCRVRWEGRTVEVRGQIYKFIAFMWNRESASFITIKHEMGDVEDKTMHTWTHRANNDLASLHLPWKLTADVPNRVVRKEPR